MSGFNITWYCGWLGIDRVVYYNSCLVTSFASTCLCHRDCQSGGRRILFIISADCLDVSLPCRPLPKPNNLYLYLTGHPAHQRSYDLLLHHGFYCSPLLHLSGEEPSFSSKSVLLSTLTPWPLPYFTALHSTTILLSHCLILSAPLSSTSYYYATIHKCSLSFQPAYSTTTICHKAIHLAASTTSYYYAIMPSAPHAMVDNVNHKQYFS